MPGTPLASLHHSIYPLMMRALVVMNWLLEYVELGRGTSPYMCYNAGRRCYGRVTGIMTPWIKGGGVLLTRLCGG